MNDKIVDSYNEMIRALIDLRQASLNDNRGLGVALEKADKALKNAGELIKKQL